MATFWVSTSGTDTASGTSLTEAVKTMTGALVVAGQGDTVNMVNDGTHSGTGTFISIGSTYDGTNYTNNVGLHVRGCDVNGTSALCTIEFTAALDSWINISNVSNYVWTEGKVFDYRPLAGTSASGLNAIKIRGNPQNFRVNDCECLYTTTTGSAIDLGGVGSYPLMMIPLDSTVAATGHIEIYNNVLVNARLYVVSGSGDESVDVHHNIIMMGAINRPGQSGPVLITGGISEEPNRFHHNTIIQEAYGDDRLEFGSVNAGAINNTTNLAFHSNLLYSETGGNVSDVAGFMVRGYSSAAQTTTIITASHNYIAIGPILAAEAAIDWDTSTTTGVYSHQYNKTWRGGGANAGTALNDNDVFDRTASLSSVFNATTVNYTWTPGNYSHNLPHDIRPLVGRTDALDGGVVGAVDLVPPVANPDTYSTTVGDTLTVTAGAGVLANDTVDGGLTLTASLVSNVGTGTLNLSSDGSFGYITDDTYVGTVTFEYKAKDSFNILSNQTTVTLNVADAPVTPPDSDPGIVYEGIIDSLPFYRPVFKADTVAMVQVRRNNNHKHIDMRHYLQGEIHDESTSRTIQVPATSGRVAVTLGGVADTQGVIVESDQVVSVSFTYNNGTTDVNFTATVNGVCAFDQVALNNIVVNNTSSTTATVNVAVFD